MRDVYNFKNEYKIFDEFLNDFQIFVILTKFDKVLHSDAFKKLL